MHAKALESLLAKTRCSKKQIKYLMSLIYNRAVQEPGKLNQYEAFSPEVYGETGFDIINKMLTRVPLSANDIFLDLGSGKRTKAFIFRTTLENIPKLNLNLLLKKKALEMLCYT